MAETTGSVSKARRTRSGEAGFAVKVQTLTRVSDFDPDLLQHEIPVMVQRDSLRPATHTENPSNDTCVARDLSDSNDFTPCSLGMKSTWTVGLFLYSSVQVNCSPGMSSKSEMLSVHREASCVMAHAAMARSISRPRPRPTEA